MTCEKYRDALIDAAAAGGPLEGKLAGHLEQCPQCRATLERERQLFSAIDDTLRVRMSERPGAGFRAGVHAQVSKGAQPRSGWSPLWALAGAALALVLIAMAHPWVRPRRPPGEGDLKGLAIRAEQGPGVAQSARMASEGSEVRGRGARHFMKQPVAQRAADREPQVLVPPDEAKAFAQFVARVARRDEVTEAFVSPAADENDELSEIPPVEIAYLQLKPLVWEKWK